MAKGELLLIIGPAAVGKMTVGRAVCARSDFRLFHNHHTIEPLGEVFGFGSPPFDRLKDEFRRHVIEEAAGAGLRLVFTFVWDVKNARTADTVTSYLAPYVDRGLAVSFVELHADLDTRLVRNLGEGRLAAKPSKRDPAWSTAHLHELEQEPMNTDPADPSTPADAVLSRFPHLRLDNTHRSAEEAAVAVLAWLADTDPALH